MQKPTVTITNHFSQPTNLHFEGLIIMQSRKVLQYLEDLAFKLGIEIVNEKLECTDFYAKGGLCKVKGVYKIFMDHDAPIQVKINILARSLSSFHTEEVYILPFIREILEKARES